MVSHACDTSFPRSYGSVDAFVVFSRAESLLSILISMVAESLQVRRNALQGRHLCHEMRIEV
jgi:hypothetical protein